MFDSTLPESGETIPEEKYSVCDYPRCNVVLSPIWIEHHLEMLDGHKYCPFHKEMYLIQKEIVGGTTP